MSTAVMPANAMYDFGDSLLKANEAASNSSSAAAASHQLGNQMRITLTRMASTPGGNTNLAMLFGNLQQQQQQQQDQQHRRLGRTHSAPAPATTAVAASLAAAAAAANSVNTSRYKTELCRPYEEFGVCKYGDKCQFAHGMNELRSLARHPKYKTELCRTYHTVGFCPYGPRCHFVHNQDEVVQQQQQPPQQTQQQQQQQPQSKVGGGLALSRQNSRQTSSRPSALSPSLSLDSPSPPCSLSQSPTSSMGSFFSSEPELHSPNADDQRLPVFNRLSTTQILQLSELIL